MAGTWPAPKIVGYPQPHRRFYLFVDLNMGTDQFFGAHTRVVAYELVQRGAQMLGALRRQGKRWNQVTLTVVLVNFAGVE